MIYVKLIYFISPICDKVWNFIMYLPLWQIISLINSSYYYKFLDSSLILTFFVNINCNHFLNAISIKIIESLFIFVMHYVQSTIFRKKHIILFMHLIL